MEAFGRYAEFYDLLNQGKSYSEEVDFVLQLIRSHGNGGSRFLELGCGTGGHATAIQQAGFDYTGLDLNEKMLDIARTKFPETTFLSQNIKDLSIAKGWDTICALYHVVNYLSTDEELFELMRKVSEILSPGGVFIFDSWYAPAVLADPPVSRTREFNSESMNVKRVSIPNHDIENRIVGVTFNFEVTEGEDSFEFSEQHDMHYYTTETVNRAAQINGLQMCEHMEWMTKAPLSESTWYATYVLKKG